MNAVLERRRRAGRRRAGRRPAKPRVVLAPSTRIASEFLPAPIDPVRPEVPVESLRDAAPHLRRPFSPDAVKWKVQATWGNKQGPTTALVVAYIDARLVVERLNLVCPHLWHDEYDLSPDGLQMLCRLTVDGITRRDIGEGYEGKGLYSDALKRAAVKFGIGVSLYAIPKITLRKQDGDVREQLSRNGKTLALTQNGEAKCREKYTEWLESHGAAAFGRVLDHGDVEGSVGDPVEAVAEVAEEPADTEGTDAIGAGPAKSIVDRAWKVDAAKRRFALAVGHVTGREPGDCSTKAKAVKAISTLTFEEAEQLDNWISRKAEEEKGESDGGS